MQFRGGNSSWSQSLRKRISQGNDAAEKYWQWLSEMPSQLAAQDMTPSQSGGWTAADWGLLDWTGSQWSAAQNKVGQACKVEGKWPLACFLPQTQPSFWSQVRTCADLWQLRAQLWRYCADKSALRPTYEHPTICVTGNSFCRDDIPPHTQPQAENVASRCGCSWKWLRL